MTAPGMVLDAELLAALYYALAGNEADDQEYYGPSIFQRLRDQYQGDPIDGGQTITVSTAVLSLTVPAQARSAFCTVTAQPIRVTFSGRTPSSSVGHHFGAGEHFTVSGRASLLGLQMIREGGSDGTLDVSYFD